MGAVIVKGNRVLSSACNKVNRHCKYIPIKKWKSSLHAEANAILSLIKARRYDDLNGADMYVTRINKVGHSMMAKPCSHCEALALSVGIRRIFYTNEHRELIQL